MNDVQCLFQRPEAVSEATTGPSLKTDEGPLQATPTPGHHEENRKSSTSPCFLFLPAEFQVPTEQSSRASLGRHWGRRRTGLDWQVSVGIHKS